MPARFTSTLIVSLFPSFLWGAAVNSGGSASFTAPAVAPWAGTFVQMLSNPEITSSLSSGAGEYLSGILQRAGKGGNLDGMAMVGEALTEAGVEPPEDVLALKGDGARRFAAQFVIARGESQRRTQEEYGRTIRDAKNILDRAGAGGGQVQASVFYPLRARLEALSLFTGNLKPWQIDELTEMVLAVRELTPQIQPKHVDLVARETAAALARLSLGGELPEDAVLAVRPDGQGYMVRPRLRLGADFKPGSQNGAVVDAQGMMAPYLAPLNRLLGLSLELPALFPGARLSAPLASRPASGPRPLRPIAASLNGPIVQEMLPEPSADAPAARKLSKREARKREQHIQAMRAMIEAQREIAHEAAPRRGPAPQGWLAKIFRYFWPAR